MARGAIAIIVAVILVASPASRVLAGSADLVDPSQFQDLHWRSIGPFRGGRVLAVDGAPDDPRRFYFGAVNGGVWKTDDAGRTWVPIFDSAPVGSIGAIAVAPSAPATLYVGTGEADMRSDIAQGVGMFKSTDSGESWTAIGLADSQAISKILVDPRDPNLLLVAALGHPYGPNPERGIFRSVDGGKSWSHTLFKDADTGAIDMAFKPDDPNVVFAALWQTRRPPWNVYPPSNGPGGGLYKSVDGGKTWLAISGHGLPAAPGRIGLATTAANPHRLFALIDAEEGGLFRSDDAGANWSRISDDKRLWQRGWYFGGITVDPKNANRLWVCNTILLRSDDGGAHFAAIKGDPTGDDFHSLWIDPNNTDRRILGVDQGALVTLNGGISWSSWFNQPTGQFYHVATDRHFPYRVYGAQQDSGAAAVPSRTDSMTDGINMTEFHEITAGDENDEIAPDPEDPEIVYGGRVVRLDLRSGQTRVIDPTIAFPDTYRGTWTLPLTFAKLSHTLYFGNQRVFSTADGGQHWKPISPDLTRPNPAVPATLDPATIADSAVRGPRRGVVYDIGPSPLSDALIWAGTDDGQVWRTRDGGANWDNVTPKMLTAWSKVGTIEASHFDAETAYIAVDRHRLDDFAPHIYRTRDGGKSWTAITAGLADGGVLNAVNVVREDPVRHGLLYAGTERGVFLSFDDGDHWQPLQRGLPRTSVRDITIHDNDLVIATHGRGFYVMDDITPLRALDLAARGNRLFAPAPAIRLHEPPFVGTPMPKDEAIASNPPDGAMIDYILSPGSALATVTITILDAEGSPVAQFESTERPSAADPAILDAAPEWVTKPAPPSATPGQHRFIWNLRYAVPSVLSDDGNLGVWAPPGRYSVELTIGDQSYRQPLEVVPDPRVRVAPADFLAEFALARQIESARVRVHATLADATKLMADLKERIQAAAPGQKAEIGALVAKLDSLIDASSDTARKAAGRPSPSVDGLSDISERLEKLAQAVDGADGAPTPDDITGFALASQALDGSIGRWEVIKQAAATNQ